MVAELKLMDTKRLIAHAEGAFEAQHMIPAHEQCFHNFHDSGNNSILIRAKILQKYLKIKTKHLFMKQQ